MSLTVDQRFVDACPNKVLIDASLAEKSYVEGGQNESGNILGVAEYFALAMAVGNASVVFSRVKF